MRRNPELYVRLAELDPNRNNRLFTLLSPACRGRKILLSGNDVVFADAEEAHIGAAMAAEAVNGTVLLEGEEAFQEILGRDPVMTVFGGGHVAQCVISMAKMCGFHVAAAEDRQEFAAKAAAAGADEVLCADTYEALFPELHADPGMVYVVLTSGHSSDRICLKQALLMPNAYVGMIGSRRKNAAVMDALRAEGIPEEALAAVHAPIGLDIGARTPAEIAVSVMAQIIQVRRGTAGSYGFPKDFLRALPKDQDAPAAILATIVEKKGSAPRGEGSKILIPQDGPAAGTIGGGSGEAQVIELARRMLGKADGGDADVRLVSIDMGGDPALREALICGGSIRVLLERV